MGKSSMKRRLSRFQLERMRAQSIKTFNPHKKKNMRLRWNLVWTILVLGMVVVLGFAPLWMDQVVGCEISWLVTQCLFVSVDAIFVIAALLTWPSLIAEIVTYLLTPWELRHPKQPEETEDGQPINVNAKGVTLNEETQLPKTCHLVIMVGYKEPIELICKTVDTVAQQTVAKSIIMVLGLEERTPDYQGKIAHMKHRYQNSFFRLICTVHPFGLPGELPGTCSNVNWGIRQSTTQMRDEGFPLDPETTIVTKLDTDCCFMPTHFEILERSFLKLSKRARLECTFQSVLIYNLSLDERWFFTRVTGILRTFFMMGFLIPYSINTMSIYSLSLHLARAAGYWVPNYQMEDILQNLNFMTGIGKRVPIRLLPIPTVSGPTSGPTLWTEFLEWWLQARRWTYGAAEVFHYYCVKFFGGKFDFLSGLSYGLSFILYYGFILCVTGLYQFFVAISVYFDHCPENNNSMLFTILLGVRYGVVFGTAFFADWLHRWIAGIEEPSLSGTYGTIRSIFHFISTPFVLLMYNFCEACAILELTYKGRDMCGHTPSKKGALIGAEVEDFDDEQTPAFSTPTELAAPKVSKPNPPRNFSEVPELKLIPRYPPRQIEEQRPHSILKNSNHGGSDQFQVNGDRRAGTRPQPRASVQTKIRASFNDSSNSNQVSFKMDDSSSSSSSVVSFNDSSSSDLVDSKGRRLRFVKADSIDTVPKLESCDDSNTGTPDDDSSSKVEPKKSTNEDTKEADKKEDEESNHRQNFRDKVKGEEVGFNNRYAIRDVEAGFKGRELPRVEENGSSSRPAGTEDNNGVKGGVENNNGAKGGVEDNNGAKRGVGFKIEDTKPATREVSRDEDTRPARREVFRDEPATREVFRDEETGTRRSRDDDDNLSYFTTNSGETGKDSNNDDSLFQTFGRKSALFLRSIMDRLASEEAAASNQPDIMQQLSAFGALASNSQPRGRNNDVKVKFRELTIEHGLSREVTIDCKVNYRTIKPSRPPLPPIT